MRFIYTPDKFDHEVVEAFVAKMMEHILIPQSIQDNIVVTVRLSKTHRIFFALYPDLRLSLNFPRYSRRKTWPRTS